VTAVIGLIFSTLITVGTTDISAIQDTIPVNAPPDSLFEMRLTPDIPQQPGFSPYNPVIQETSEEPEEAPPDTVYVWRYDTPATLGTAETDSTLRWLGYVNMAERFYRERGAVTYRLGTNGRMDGVEIFNYESRHVDLEMEGMRINTPLTGLANWNRLVVHRVSEMTTSDFGASYRADVRLRDHYLVEPRTYLNFDESKFNNRSLEFSFSQNFRKDTNVEFSFWDRRDGGGYRRSNVQGNQATVRVYHQLSDPWLLKAGFINNSLDRDESFGYAVTNPELFAFNRFTESPLEGNADSKQASSDIYFQLHHRADTSETVSSKLGLHFQTHKWNLTYSADSLDTAFRNAEIFSQHRVRVAGAEITGTSRLYLLNEKNGDNLSRTSWTGVQMSLGYRQRVFGFLDILGNASSEWISDGRQTSSLSLKTVFRPSGRLKLSVFGGAASIAPDIQSLYWESRVYTGNSELRNEDAVYAGASAEIGLGRYFTLGLRGDLRENDGAPFLNDENGFTAIDAYTTTSGTGWLSFNSRIFEGELSGQINSYSSQSLQPVNQLLNSAGERIWVKSRLFWKNYVFDRAAFVKAGVIGHFTPGEYRAAQYITPLNRWQHGTQELLNPLHYRMDVEISARIRWFMMLLAWENVLDRAGQLGYFETVGYPMPARRFKFGIRVLFTN
jgi:hypothetical protein